MTTLPIVRAWAASPGADDPHADTLGSSADQPAGRGTSKPRRALWTPRPDKGSETAAKPRRPKKLAATPAIPLSRADQLLRASLSMLAAIMFGFLVNLAGLSSLQHIVAQQELRASFAEQLAAGIAPVSEGDYNNVLLNDGDPVARLQIPAIGVDEIVAEGTSSGVLTTGLGHRRDTILPGQAGVSVIMGRAAAYGGPFSKLQKLVAGDTITVLTGQGQQNFRVLGVRYAGDATTPFTAGTGRLVLETARGLPYMPSGVVRVDAVVTSTVQADGARQTAYTTLPAQDKELASDLSTVWALVLALQFLIVAEAAAVWSWRRFGGTKTWVVLVPVLLLAGLLVADQVTRLLPNLM
jgi:sortase A